MVSLSQGRPSGLGCFNLRGATVFRIEEQVVLNKGMSSSVLRWGGEASIVQVLGAAMRASEDLLAVKELMYQEQCTGR